MEAIVKGIEGSGISVIQAKVSLQTTGLAIQLLKIRDQYKCFVKLIETKVLCALSKKRYEQSKNLTLRKTPVKLLETNVLSIPSKQQYKQSQNLIRRIHLQHQPLRSKRNAKQKTFLK